MRLIAKCKDTMVNIKVDGIERKEDVIFAYRQPHDAMAEIEFAGMFDLGSMDYLYVTEERA